MANVLFEVEFSNVDYCYFGISHFNGKDLGKEIDNIYIFKYR